MFELTGYRVLNKAIETPTWSLYTAQIKNTDQLVSIKKFNRPFEGNNMVIHDYHIGKSLEGDGFLKPLSLERSGNEVYIITEYYAGTALSNAMDHFPTNLYSFLKIAIQLANIIHVLHEEQFIHQAILPENILFEYQTEQVKLTGFSSVTKLANELKQPENNLTSYDEVFHYLSPEQTGRMNRSLDERTDLYTLGVVLYELLTGRRPITGTDPARIIHAHLTKKPKPPHQINQNTPKILSNIIMKLLEKLPEDRYQSAFGLKEDLEICLIALKHQDEIKSFPLGQSDLITKFEPTNQLFGKQEAKQCLYDAFERICTGKCELVQIPGASGIGKTRLVHEIHRPLIQEKGYFASVKFMEQQEQMLFMPLIDAFRGLFRQILAENESRLSYWKIVFERELGQDIYEIASLIPELSIIMNLQTTIPLVSTEVAHLKLQKMLGKLVGAIANREHPLVLFIDDLQWADKMTYRLLSHVLQNEHITYLLIIVAYRDDGLVADHPLIEMIQELSSSVHITKAIINPLSLDEIESWTASMFDLKHEEFKFFNRFLYSTTTGNPFYLNLLFKSFYDDALIRYSISQKRWTVQIEQVQQLTITESFIHFIMQRIANLPQETQDILELAACLGNTFSLDKLSMVTHLPYTKIATILWPALREGFILPLNTGYKWVYSNEQLPLVQGDPPMYMFLHDKVQSAFYLNMNEHKIQQIHLQIGRALCKGFVEEIEGEKRLEVVNHLNLCHRKLSKLEKQELIHWNIQAGEDALLINFEQALSLFNAAKLLLTDNCWETAYDLTYRLYLGLAEAQYLNQLFTEAKETCDYALQYVVNQNERIQILKIKMDVYNHLHRVKEGTQVGLDVAKIAGIHLNENPKDIHVLFEYIRTKIAIFLKGSKNLKELSSVKNDQHFTLLQTLTRMIAPAYHYNERFALILMMKLLRLTLKLGNTEVTPLIYSNYALFLIAGMRNFKKGDEFNQLAIEQANVIENPKLQAHAYFVYGIYTSNWTKHIRYSGESLCKARKYAIETGELHIANACGAFISIVTWLKGKHLGSVIQDIKKHLEYAEKSRSTIFIDFLQEMYDWTGCLQHNDEITSWSFSQFEETSANELVHYIFRLQMTYLFNERIVASEILKKLTPILSKAFQSLLTPIYHYYHGLWLIRFIHDGYISKNQGQTKLKKTLHKLKLFSEASPVNYQHHYLFVEAALFELKNDHQKAIQLFNKAVSIAKENQFMQDVAIINECIGEYYLRQKLPVSAKSYLQEAYDSYLGWGAQRLANALHIKYPNLIETKYNQVHARSETKHVFDIDALIATSNIISSELDLTELLSKLMYVVLTHACADFALLTIEDDEKLYVTAEQNQDGAIEVTEEVIEFETKELPYSILRYVRNTKETVILENASVHGDFTKDPYIMKRKPKSVICLPVNDQYDGFSILYLENNQATNVFTKERIKLLTLISKQGAISIKNARLYISLEDKVRSRTKMLNEMNHQLTKVNESLAKSESTRKQMLENISHDLRAPLQAARNYIHTIIDGLITEPEAKRQQLMTIQDRLSLLNDMILDLFNLARLESGNIVFEKEVIPIDQLFLFLAERFAIGAKDAGLEFTKILPKKEIQLFPLVLVDVRRIEQVMTNLMTNAIKYMDKGTIAMQLEIKSKTVLIQITDEGSGIERLDLPYIFDRTFTKKGPQGEKGNGLGLAISKEIIALHDGKIWASSVVGSGTTFYIELPIYELTEDEII